jgi:hypothetical protein
MGVTIDFGNAARKRRPLDADRAAMAKVEQIDDIKARLKVDLCMALSLLDLKINLLDDSMMALDPSRCETVILREQIDRLKQMMRTVTSTVATM